MATKFSKIFTILILAAVLFGGCSPNQPQEPAPNNNGGIGMANPASVYCTEQGYTLEMRQNENGEYGVCIFPDGSECEEWAYFRNECQPGDVPTGEAATGGTESQTTPEAEPLSMQVYALYGNVISSGQEVPAPSILVTYPEDLATIYITGETGEIEDQIVALQDQPEPGNHANFWGRLDCPTLDECLLTVTDILQDGPNPAPLPDQVVGWDGVIYSGPPEPRSGGDDYFALLGDLPFQYGIDGADDAIRQQIEMYRDSGQAVRITGELHAGRPDWNGTQIIVTSIEPIIVDSSLIPPTPEW